jgi:hypothetical protein
MDEWIKRIQSLDFPVPLPETLLEVEQQFDGHCIDDVPGTAERVLSQANLARIIKPGESVAIGLGSRGIRDAGAVARVMVAHLRALGAQPFIFPAMGSHGGATAEGQREMLADMGITESAMGAVIRATMDAVQIGALPDGPALFQDAYAHAADHTIFINRVKPHTDFHGKIESGLAKMAVIGMGKQRGASLMHNYGAPGFRSFLAPAARIYETATNLRGGLALVENAYDETAEIAWLEAVEIGAERETALLERARALLATLPFDTIDMLVVREIGKNISGTGMDTNVIGDKAMDWNDPGAFDAPDITAVVVLDLTPETHGNALGIGLAGVTTARVLRKFDPAVTHTNAITAGVWGLRRSNIPLVLADDRRALRVGLRCCGQPPELARIVMIENTLRLNRLWVSANLRGEVEAHPRLTAREEVPLAFDAAGTMAAPWVLT